MTEKAIEKEVFIPIVPGKRARLGMLFSQAIPGAILALSVAGTHPVTVGGGVSYGFCLISGLLVVFLALKEFRVPGTVSKLRIDMITVFTGFLVIAQGTQLFNALKGFQPAHLYFLAGTIFIFKGVMLPQAKFKKGFILTDETISYTSSPLRAAVKLSRAGLEAMDVTANKIKFRYSTGETKIVNLRGAANPEELVAALKRIVFPAP